MHILGALSAIPRARFDCHFSKGADFANADLSSADLSFADLSEASLMDMIAVKVVPFLLAKSS